MGNWGIMRLTHGFNLASAIYFCGYLKKCIGKEHSGIISYPVLWNTFMQIAIRSHVIFAFTC